MRRSCGGAKIPLQGEEESMRGWITWPETKQTLRLMRKQPIIATTVIMALAIGIGVATTGFTFLDSVLFGELPFENGDRFVRLRAFSESEGLVVAPGADRVRLLREHAGTFAYLGAGASGSAHPAHRGAEPPLNGRLGAREQEGIYCLLIPLS
jgi:hypothetical protein